MSQDPRGYQPPAETPEARAFRLNTEGGPGGLRDKRWCNRCQRYHGRFDETSPWPCT